MSVISFQGAVFLKTEGGPPTIYLPKSKASTHLDRKRTVEHYSRIWVANAAIVRSANAFEADDSGTGQFFDLDGGASNGRAYHIAVENVDGSPVDVSKLKNRLFQFSKFAKYIGAPSNPSGKSTTRVPLTLGSIDFELTDHSLGPWKIDATLGATQQMQQIAWDIRWTLKATDPNQPIRISVRSGTTEMAWIEVKPASVAGEIIIGNLDHKDAGTWRGRRKIKVADCKDAKGNQTDRCPDLDFKWLYRLFNHGTVTAQLKGKDLPVPKRVLSERGTPPGLDTPTCFPGTD